jgi:hypothetical protein
MRIRKGRRLALQVLDEDEVFDERIELNGDKAAKLSPRVALTFDSGSRSG